MPRVAMLISSMKPKLFSTKPFSVSTRIGKMKFLTFFTILTLTQGLKVKQYQKTKVGSFQVIKTTPQPQSTLHCSFLCKNELTCEGFQLDDNTCKTLKNLDQDYDKLTCNSQTVRSRVRVPVLRKGRHVLSVG